VYVKKHYVYVQFGVMFPLLHYWCDFMRLLCVVWSVGKRSACFVVSKRGRLSLVWQVLLLWGGGVAGGVSDLSRGAGVRVVWRDGVSGVG